MIDEANEILRAKGYCAAHLNASAAPLPGQGAAQGHEDPQPVLRLARGRAARRARLRADAPRSSAGARSRRTSCATAYTRGMTADRFGAASLRRPELTSIHGTGHPSGRHVRGDEPGDRRELAHVPRMGAEETQARARGRRPRASGLARCPPATAREILRRFADLMLEHEDDLALLMTLEQGKPLSEAHLPRSSTPRHSSSGSARRRSASTATRSRSRCPTAGSSSSSSRSASPRGSRRGTSRRRWSRARLHRHSRPAARWC